jgi:hypothetical protein
LRLRNVGSGPAILLTSFLLDHSGKRAELQGNPAIAAGEVERYTASMSTSTSTADRFKGPESPSLRAIWGELAADTQCRERTFLLIVHYLGVAPNPEVEMVEAVFDPRGTGRWRTALQQKNPGLMAGAPGS